MLIVFLRFYFPFREMIYDDEEDEEQAITDYGDIEDERRFWDET